LAVVVKCVSATLTARQINEADLANLRHDMCSTGAVASEIAGHR
jgi:hypothetical protein